MRIIEFKAENVKRIQVVEIRPDGNLVQITGKNGEGKTSVLDAIWWALDGTDGIQSMPIRKGADSGLIELKLGDNGETKLIVERKFTEKGSYLTVKNADGFRAGSPQKMLDELLGALAFDPLAFMRQRPKDQFDTLRALVPIEADIPDLDKKRQGAFDQRTEVNRKIKELTAQAAAIVVLADCPKDQIDTAPIMAELAGVDEFNKTVRDQIRSVEDLSASERTLKANLPKIRDDWDGRRTRAETNVDNARAALKAAIAEEDRVKEECKSAIADAQRLADEAAQLVLEAEKIEIPALKDSSVLIQKHSDAERINDQVKKRTERDVLDERANKGRDIAWGLTLEMAAIDKIKADAIAEAPMPIKGLAFGDGAVTFEGIPLDQASDAQQLMVSAAIAAALNPELRIIRIRDGSLLDDDAMKRLAAFADKHNFQIWIERVDGSGEVGIVMEDGMVKTVNATAPSEPEADEGAPEPQGDLLADNGQFGVGA